MLKNPKMYVGMKGRDCACEKRKARFLTTSPSLRENRKIPFLAKHNSSPAAPQDQYRAASLTCPPPPPPLMNN